MIVYRITHQKYGGWLTSPGTPGRWNSKGHKVLYTACNISLALLENLYARRGYGFNNDYSITVISVKGSNLLEYRPETLPPGWNDPANYATAQKIGDAWYQAHKQLMLKVPSAILPVEYNIVFNTSMAGWITKVDVVDILPLALDGRIEDLLKQYKSR